MIESLTQLAINLEVPLQNLVLLPNFKYTESEWQLLSNLFDVLPLTLANLKLSFKESEQVDFTEIAMSALYSVNSENGDSTEGAVFKSMSLKHILVDEFQDVNNVQMNIIQHLVDHWGQDKDKSIFLVGDAMQSLYGFRGSDVTQFMKAESGVGQLDINTLELKSNFRSSAGIVKWVNNVFCNIFPSNDDLILASSSYKPASAVKKDHQTEVSDSVEVHGFINDRDGVGESEFVLKEVKKIQEESPQSSIAILGQTRGALRSILEAIEREDLIDANEVKLKKIAKHSNVIQLASLAKVLIDDFDKAAWVSLLNGPFVGLSLNSLESVFGSVKIKDPFYHLSKCSDSFELEDSERERFNSFMNLITIAMDDRYLKTLDSILEGLWIELSGDSLAKSMACVANVNTVLEVLRDKMLFDIDAEWLDRQLDKLYAAPLFSPEKVNKSKVSVMTVHQSKGLEFDYVFIVGATRKSAITQSHLIAWDQLPNNQVSVLACSADLEIGGQDKNYYQFIGAYKRKKELEELKRVGYVAITRGIKKVWIMGNVNQKEGEIKIPNKNSLLGVLFESGNIAIESHQVLSDKNDELIIPQIEVIERDLNDKLPECHLLEKYRGEQTTSTIKSATEWELQSSEIERTVFNELKGRLLLRAMRVTEEDIKKYSLVIFTLLKQHGIDKDSMLKSTLKIRNDLINQFERNYTNVKPAKLMQRDIQVVGY